LSGDGNKTSKNSWRYTTISKQLAEDVQEIAIKCGMAASMTQDKEKFYRVKISTTLTAQCNLGEKRSQWTNYDGMVYCVEVPNSTVMVRQNGYAYFSGNSKGTGDQYTLDWARIYGLKTVVFRQSGIYGPHQFGIEEQGWLAWFINSLLFDRPVTIYGDGKQVRDVLYIDDVLEAYDAALTNINTTRGKAYNIGGGLEYSLSIWELFEIIEKLDNNKFKYSFGDWRPGDQKAYISEIKKAKSDFNWSPKVSPQEGVAKLYQWIKENKKSIIKSGVFPQNYPIVK
jgi:dTDP-D-glucose 4,6-dehydratase